FLGFEALWYKDLKDLLKLMEGVSATYNLHMALLWFDRDCNIGKDLERSGQLGLLHKINKSGQAQIICKFNGYSDATIADFMNKPAYVSAFDVT
ncbi:MAG TPA: hypothetical protein VL947_07950, partial [Cytophagales bacterium]|nr:hypothetical protein [Cytophagales bacterium]